VSPNATTETSVLEIEEAGVLLRAEGTHLIKVLGARRQEHVPRVAPMKENLPQVADASVVDGLYTGQLHGPSASPEAPPDTPQVPQFFITDAGQAVFLQRNVPA
jgi:hypothetical protein